MKENRGAGERTTVSLTPGLARRLSYEAARSKRSASAVVRDALERYFAESAVPELPSFVGVGESGRSDISERVDEEIEEILERPGGRARE